MVKLFVWFGFILVFLLMVAFALLNTQAVTIYYYVGQMELRLTLLLFSVLCLGVLLSSIAHFLWLWKLRRDNQRLKKSHKNALHEINTLVARTQDTSTQ
ncbi:LapA family protein [Candidatus Albibeggiatoa sp. nov. BB20]|uniref:LapA family protein n=1 Tax=Candidatus Albibeggiatoa sp. nov. BB20 TaxID=3162723 RepID=UPI00336567DA